MFGRRSIFALLLVLLMAAPVFAHDPGLSAAHVTRTSAGVVVRLTFSWSALSPLISHDPGSERPAASSLAALGTELGHSGVRFAQVYSDGILQPAVVPALSPGVTSVDELVVSLEWSRVPPGLIRMEFPVLAKMPFGHRMILIIGESEDAVALLDADHTTWELPAASAVTANANAKAGSPAPSRPGWTSFVMLGVEHILTGFDHLCFLFALLLVAIRLRDVLAVVTTFTVAHSLSLAAAATGVVSLSPRIVEPLIAASIVYIGIENLFLRRSPSHRLALVFCFGLVHGLGFASALAERLPGITGFAVVPPLLGFNAGVELGQLAVAACLVPLIRLARARPAYAPRLQPAFSLMIATAGFIWFCQRV
jgi:hydrogenase/urease accessory protein HupE